MSPRITREALGVFILSALNGQGDVAEWQHFMVAHYVDEEMETARRECVRLIGVPRKGDSDLPADDVRRLRAAPEKLAIASSL